MSRTTWRVLLREAMEESTSLWHKPEIEETADPGPVLFYAPNEAAFDVEFEAGYGSTNGPPVLAWTERCVYFPVCYDGAEWLGRAPRDPRPQGQHHEGGG